jgi:hypothetical protein
MAQFYTKLVNYWERNRAVRSIAYIIMASRLNYHFAAQIWPIESQRQTGIALILLFAGWLGWQPKRIRRRFEIAALVGVLLFLWSLGGGGSGDS